MKKLVKSGFTTVILALVAACGGGGDAPAAPGGTAPPTVGTAPVTTPPVTTPPAVVIPPVLAPPAVVIPPLLPPPTSVTPPVAGVPPSVALPPTVVAPPTVGGYSIATKQDFYACPTGNAATSNWWRCLAGKRLVGTEPFGSGACELRINSDGSMRYLSATTDISVPAAARWSDIDAPQGSYGSSRTSGIVIYALLQIVLSDQPIILLLDYIDDTGIPGLDNKSVSLNDNTCKLP